MNRQRHFRCLSLGVMMIGALAVTLGLLPCAAFGVPDTSEPSATVKLVFIHHSTGDAWLQDGYGGLAHSLGANNYFVSDTNYGWGPGSIGDHTDIGDWWTWFRGPSAGTYTSALYTNTGINSSYARSLANPGGDNTVIMFKSCFPNSAVGGSPSDGIPSIGSNPLAGVTGQDHLTVGNAKGVYLDLLNYFAFHQDKLFVLVVSPPLKSDATNSTQAANARALANWLVDPAGYLSGYSGHNVFVFDYYTVLTGGHHRIAAGLVEHSAGPSNYSAYPTGDSHPSAAGDQIATNEFVPMLNAAYHSWQASESASLPPTMTHRTATLSAPYAGKTRLHAGTYYRWYGSISPLQQGSSSVTLQIQRLVRGVWRPFTTVTASLRDGASSWAVRFRLKHTASYRVRAVHADGDHYPANSKYRRFSVH